MKPTKALAGRRQETHSNENVVANVEFVIRAALHDSVEKDFVHSVAVRIIVEPEIHGKENAGQPLLRFRAGRVGQSH